MGDCRKGEMCRRYRVKGKSQRVCVETAVYLEMVLDVEIVSYVEIVGNVGDCQVGDCRIGDMCQR